MRMTEEQFQALGKWIRAEAQCAAVFAIKGDGPVLDHGKALRRAAINEAREALVLTPQSGG